MVETWPLWCQRVHLHKKSEYRCPQYSALILTCLFLSANVSPSMSSNWIMARVQREGLNGVGGKVTWNQNPTLNDAPLSLAKSDLNLPSSHRRQAVSLVLL